MSSCPDKTPVTILTGFLGAGKTTLVNRILSVDHGERIAVIENEYGEVGIDDALIVDTDEQVVEMNNGCICCTVRGDLVNALEELDRRREQFDYVLIETTGLADPGPVAQTFFLDPEISERYRLDGIVTVVDAKHAPRHLDETDECPQQVAFGNIILVNKTDLVDDAHLASLEHRLTQINSTAEICRTERAGVDLETILDIGAFDLERTIGSEPDFLLPELPFHWAGAVRLAPGSYTLRAQSGPDPRLSLAVLPSEATGHVAIDERKETAVRLFGQPPQPIADGQSLTPGPTHWQLQVGDKFHGFELHVGDPTTVVFFAEHDPGEYAMVLCDDDDRLVPWDQQCRYEDEHGHDHDHTDRVTSVSFRFERAFDGDALDRWLGSFVANHGPDLFRMKGLVAIDGLDVPMVFHGIHMLFDARPAEPLRDDPRRSQLVFIGRHLDANHIRSSLEQCLQDSLPARSNQ
jgi:G3E family GTPase